MSDPIGTSGGARRGGIGDLDLSAVLNGGDEFTSRLRQLAALKQEHNDALEKLNLGKSAQTAHKEAQDLHQVAKNTHSIAEGVLVKAQEEAQKIINAARSQAANIIANAEGEASGIVSQATEMLDGAGIERGTVENLKKEATALRDAHRESLAKADRQRMENDHFREGLNRQMEATTEQLETLVKLRDDLLKLFKGAGL